MDLARVVARGVERKAAPLICYAVGGVLAGLDEAGQQAFIAELVDGIGDEPVEATPG